MIDGPNDKDYDEEVYPGSELSWRIVKDATRADKILESSKRRKKSWFYLFL